MTLTFFFSMFCSLSGISLSWKTLVFGRFTSQERTNVHRTAFFLHTPDFSLSKVTALKEVWGKDTSRRSKERGCDLLSCFSAWEPFCKCGWRHHISRSGCCPDWRLCHSSVVQLYYLLRLWLCVLRLLGSLRTSKTCLRHRRLLKRTPNVQSWKIFTSIKTLLLSHRSLRPLKLSPQLMFWFSN